MRIALKNRATALAIALGALSGLGVAGCRGGTAEARTADPPPMTVGPENIVVAKAGLVHLGPALSGNLRAERQATIRAEVAGAVLQTYADRGQRVQAGQLLARLDDAALRDQYLSARSAVTTAAEAAALASRNLERTRRLVQVGALADKDLETAQLSASSARSQLEDARARMVEAQKQLGKTEIRAPLAGVVSDRPVSAGDVVQVGAALFTVVDPTSMRLDAAIPADQLGTVHVGAPVFFSVTGYSGRSFEGHVERINPAADPATGQVPIYVSIPNGAGSLVAGLYAQGRVASETRQGIIVPIAALQDNGSAAPTVMRIRNGRVESVEVKVGLRDEQAETVEVVAGLAPGDTLLVGTAQGLTPGTPVRVQALKEGPA